MTTFLLIRHAMTDQVGTTLTGWTGGVRLNESGRAQAEALAVRLAQVALAAIYYSPLERARETAELLARRLKIEIRLCPEAGEIQFGDWTGRKFEDLNAEAEWRRFNTLRSLTRPPNGESMLEVQARMLTLLTHLCDTHTDETVAIVTHADVIKATVAHYAGVPLDLMHRLEISPASISAIAINEDGPRILLLNDTGRYY